MLSQAASSGKRVALSGGGGFLGSHLLPLLLEGGFDLTCLARPSPTPKRFDARIRLVSGNCASLEDMRQLIKNQDVFIHMASLLFGNSWQDYIKANALAAQNIVIACNSLKTAERPQKIVFISSLAAAGPCAQSPGLAENCQPNPVSAYGWSKLLCENILKGGKLPGLLIFRPPIIYGSRDRGLLPMFRSAKIGLGISPGLKREFPVSVIHARDMARAIRLALEKDATGLFHINDGHEYSMAEFCRGMGRALKKPNTRILRVPLPVMGLSAGLSTAAAISLAGLKKIFGLTPMRPPHWNIDKFREARSAGWLADASLIREALGFTAEMDLQAGMEEAVSGYRAEGCL